MRALSLNVFAQHGDWPARREVPRAGLARLRPDVIALQDSLLVRSHAHGPALRIADCRLAFDAPVEGVIATAWSPISKRSRRRHDAPAGHDLEPAVAGRWQLAPA